MSYDLVLRPRTSELDPRDEASVQRWWDVPEDRTSTVSPAMLEQLVQLVVARVTAECADAPHEHRGKLGVELTCDDFQLSLYPHGGEMALSADEMPDWVQGLIEDVARIAGWAAYDPQTGHFVAGIEFICTVCDSAIPATEQACGVCGASISKR